MSLSPDTIQLLQQSGYSKIPSALAGPSYTSPNLSPSPAAQPMQPAAPVAQAPGFDSPEFLQELLKGGTVDEVDRIWRYHTGADRVFSAIDHEMMNLKMANPNVPAQTLANIAESRKAQLLANAPGVSTLAEAKRIIADREKAASELAKQFDHSRHSRVAEFVKQGMPYNKAVLAVDEEMPYTEKTEEPSAGFLARGGRVSSGQPSGSETSSPNANLIDAVAYGKEKSDTLKYIQGNPDAAFRSAQDAVMALNQNDITPNEDNPELAAQAESLAGAKARSRDYIDALAELQREGKSPVLVAKTEDQITDAYKAGKPVVIEMPDGKYTLKQFRSPEELENFVFDEYKKSKGQAKPGPEQPKKSEPFLPEALRRFMNFQTLDETDQRIAELAPVASESNPDVVSQLQARKDLETQKKYRGKKQAKDEATKTLQEYYQLSQKVGELMALARDPELPMRDQNKAKEEAEKISLRVEELKRTEAVQELLRRIEQAASAIPVI